MSSNGGRKLLLKVTRNTTEPEGNPEEQEVCLQAKYHRTLTDYMSYIFVLSFNQYKVNTYTTIDLGHTQAPQHTMVKFKTQTRSNTSIF